MEAKLSKTVKDCNTVNPIAIWVRSDEHLKKLNGRRYRFSQRDPYKIIDYEKDKDLIGERIWIRSPVTCAAPDGICKECYGELYNVNKDLHSVGGYAAVTQLNPVVQGLLSAKHFQGTTSKLIDFNNPEFSKFFVITTTEVILNPDLEDPELYTIVILQSDMKCSDYGDDNDDIDHYQKFNKKKRGKKRSDDFEDDSDDIIDSGMGEDGEDDLDYRMNYFASKFYVVKNLHSKDPSQIEIMKFEDPNTSELFMHDDVVNRMVINNDNVFDQSYFTLEFTDIDLTEFIFMVDVKNNELTVPMKKIQSLIFNANHAGARTLEDMVQMMLDLTIESKFSAASIHGETIIRQLIRSSRNILVRPTFSRIIMSEDYRILSVMVALKQNKSFSTSMSSSYLKFQLVQSNTTFDKQDTSDFDWWYKRKLVIDEDELWYGDYRN
jgi:hypothetical protein